MTRYIAGTAVKKPYDMTGPFDDVANYHWRMQDILNAITSSGLRLVHIDEMYDDRSNGYFWFYENVRAKMNSDDIDDYYNWKVNPYAALPQWFSLYARK